MCFVFLYLSFSFISDQALAAQIGIQCRLINQNCVVHEFQEHDSTGFIQKGDIPFLCRKTHCFIAPKSQKEHAA